MGPCPALTKRRLVVLADTNFLIMIVRGEITPTLILDTLERSYVVLVCNTIVSELKHLSTSAPHLSTRRAAKRALELLNNIPNTCVIECPEGKADDSLLIAALYLKDGGTSVVLATNDRELRRRARQVGIPTLYYRESERRLEIDWEIL